MPCPCRQAAEEAAEEEEEEEEDNERRPARSASLPTSPSAPDAGSASEADSLEAQLAAVRAQAKAMASVRANSSLLNGAAWDLTLHVSRLACHWSLHGHGRFIQVAV